MKKHHIVDIMRDDYTTVKVCFTLTGQVQGKQYTYKTTDRTLQPGDLVVVCRNSEPTYNPTDYSVVQVVVVDEHPDIDTDADYKYKWIVGKICLEDYTEKYEEDKKALAKLTAYEREAKRQQVIEGLKLQYGQELALFGPKKLEATTSPAVEDLYASNLDQETPKDE